jgi:hypothetical protein
MVRGSSPPIRQPIVGLVNRISIDLHIGVTVGHCIYRIDPVRDGQPYWRNSSYLGGQTDVETRASFTRCTGLGPRLADSDHTDYNPDGGLRAAGRC